MDWTRQVDGYCERTDLTFWAEPLNAITNLAFVIGAAWMWRRCEGIVGARVLCVVLFLIGIGSFLFHTTATVWAGVADVTPIAAFILIYLFLVNRDVVGWPIWAATLGTLAYIPYAALLMPGLTRIPFLRISNFYWTVPILLLIYAFALRHRVPATARGMVIGAGILCLSITIRSLDDMLCPVWPTGTHILWHILNGVMLTWMIEVYRRHQIAARTA